MEASSASRGMSMASLGKLLAQFLSLFASCFRSTNGRALFATYVRGLLSELQRKSVETIALGQGVSPRTLHCFLETIKRDHGEVMRRCRQLIARDHLDADAIGVINETGTMKSRKRTVGVKRQHNGNHGKIENTVVNVTLSIATRSFQCLLGVQMYLPKEWAEYPTLRKKTYVPDNIEFAAKSEFALQLIDQALADGVVVKAWKCDEFDSRDGKFLGGLDECEHSFVGEVPPKFTMWLQQPKILKNPNQNQPGRPRRYPRLAARDSKASEVQNLAKYSPGLTKQTPQRWRVRDSHQGPEIWEVHWHVAYRKTHTKQLVSHQCTLLVARNTRTNETKYFISNRVPWRNGWSVRELLRIAFARWHVEACFREVKEELGWDHFECRGGDVFIVI